MAISVTFKTLYLNIHGRQQVRYLFALLSFFTVQATASADCPVYPKAEWADREVLRQALLEEGYTIKKLHTSGNCYEVYGRNKAGKYIEIYFDTKTFAIIKS